MDALASADGGGSAAGSALSGGGFVAAPTSRSLPGGPSRVPPFAAVAGLLVIPANRRRPALRPEFADDGPAPALLAGDR